MEIERINSGVEGLDKLISGGFPKGSTILITGGPGTGKSTLCLNYLVSGALNYNEPGIYISLEEDPPRTIWNIKASFSWPIEELIKKNIIKLVKAEIYDFDKLRMLIEDEVDSIGAKRLVIDPTTVLGLFFERPLEIRRGILDMDRMLKKMGCTSLLTSDVPEGSTGISSFGIEEFTSDGIIILYYLQKRNVFIRALTVRKMRATKHDNGIHPMEITQDGIVVYPKELILL
jgi:KaiC/GvpD/RAD55 family RecA-like ATPase